jgi:hypothetical protein
MKKEDILVGNDVYFIAGDGKLYPCRVIAYDSEDTDIPFLVSFGSNLDSAPDDVGWRISKSDISEEDGVGEDVVHKHHGELAKWARLDELLWPRLVKLEDCSMKTKDAYPETYWLEENAHDAVNHPSHYCRDGIECIDVIKAITKGLSAFDAFCQGNAMKYLFRWQFKNGAEDLKKARWYIDKLLEQWDGQVNNKGD